MHGPPGCGKTFAVERLVDFLGWPSFQIDASSVASPYIHETSKKVAEVFDKAMQNAPSVLVIDEMEAFLADREMGSGHHRVEEVAEFLRRIPEATKNDVLIVAMTNRIEMIDPAILRRGRFDHVIKVDYRQRDRSTGAAGQAVVLAAQGIGRRFRSRWRRDWRADLCPMWPSWCAKARGLRRTPVRIIWIRRAFWPR